MSFRIQVKSASGSWSTGAGVGDLIPDMGFNYTDKLNAINEANINISSTGETKRALIAMGSEVKIWRDDTLEFHGLINTIDYLEGGGIAINAKGYEWWLGLENGAYAGSPWSSTASATIFNAVIGESNYFTAGTVDAGTSVDYRAAATDSIWNVICDLKEATAQDIGIDYPNSEIDILDHKGSATSIKTFNAGIQMGNVRIGQSYPLANKVLVYGKSEGETRITSEYPSHGYNEASQSTYGIITKIIRDPKISTVAQANILADAEVARLKDPIKVYDFEVMNPNQTLISGDVITLNARSQGVSNEDVRIVGIERGEKAGGEYLTLQVTNAAYSKLTKNISEIMANIDKNFRDQQTYDGFQDEYSNRIVNTTIGGVINVGVGTGAVGMNPIIPGTNFWFLTEGAGDIYLSPGSSGQVFIVGLGDVNVGYNKIVSLDTPTSTYDAANKYYVDTYGGWSGTATSNLNMAGYDILDVDDLDVRDIYHPTSGTIDFFDDVDGNLNDLSSPGNQWDDFYVQDIDLYGFMDPISDNNVDLGHSGGRYRVVYCVTLYEGDHVYHERTCLLCDKSFLEGESVVNYVLSNTEEGTRTIPVHLGCAIDGVLAKGKHQEVIQKLKDMGNYVDPDIEIVKQAEIKKNKEEKDNLKEDKKRLSREIKELKKGINIIAEKKEISKKENQIKEIKEQITNKNKELMEIKNKKWKRKKAK